MYNTSRCITKKREDLFNLESASNVAKSLSGLQTKGILRKEKQSYVFEDVFFGRWIESIAGF
jgi:hypothetical protein